MAYFLIFVWLPLAAIALSATMLLSIIWINDGYKFRLFDIIVMIVLSFFPPVYFFIVFNDSISIKLDTWMNKFPAIYIFNRGK